MPLSPKMRFRLNRLQNRWETWRASLRQTRQAVTAEQKMCPSCRALVQRGQSACPYCGQRLKVFAASPVGKLASRAMPTIPVTGWLILANFVMFVMEYAISGTSPFANLMAGPSPRATLRLGMSVPLFQVVATHQYWRWITACFLHGGLLHIGFNMWALYDIGPMVESFYGGAKFFTFYMLAGIGGYILSGFFGNYSLGASGAIVGLLGIMLAYGIRRSHTAAGRQLRAVAGRWAVYILIFSFLPGVDIYAHVGGFITGFILGMMVGDDPPLTESQIRAWRLIQTIMLAVVAISFFLMARPPGH